MKPMKTSISITLDDPVLEQVKLLAETQDRSVSSYINLVLKAHLEQLGEKDAR
ncbi:MAG: ribbon-helix-helix protein, CopG family [Lawsonibacter sp.]